MRSRLTMCSCRLLTTTTTKGKERKGGRKGGRWGDFFLSNNGRKKFGGHPQKNALFLAFLPFFVVVFFRRSSLFPSVFVHSGFLKSYKLKKGHTHENTHRTSQRASKRERERKREWGRKRYVLRSSCDIKQKRRSEDLFCARWWWDGNFESFFLTYRATFFEGMMMSRVENNTLFVAKREREFVNSSVRQFVLLKFFFFVLLFSSVEGILSRSRNSQKAVLSSSFLFVKTTTLPAEAEKSTRG